MITYLKKQLEMDFDVAVERVSKVLSEEGFGILGIKAIDEVFKEKLQVDYPKYTTIMACGAKFAKAALDVSKEAGLLFPCSFVVYEEEGKVFVSHISIMKIAPEIGLAPKDQMQSVIEMTGEAVHRAWDRL
ncbi:MAG: DUF302 domain-containing protein [Promethearchaeota archaeon]